MSANRLEPLLLLAERRAVVEALRRHPDWTLAHIADVLDRDGPRALVLGSLTIGELLEDGVAPARDGGPPIDAGRLALAQQLTGPEFDAHVREVLAEAGGRAVGASYLRARLGGPRWKLQDALRRLVGAGLAERSGVTSTTRYRVLAAERA